jgi:hypothetical protein
MGDWTGNVGWVLKVPGVPGCPAIGGFAGTLWNSCPFFFFCLGFHQKIQAKRAITNSPPTAAPTAIPAVAPVLRPLSSLSLVGSDVELLVLVAVLAVVSVVLALGSRKSSLLFSTSDSLAPTNLFLGHPDPQAF